MKNIIFFLSLILSSISFAQICNTQIYKEPVLIGRAGKSKLSYPVLELIKGKNANVYAITYQNAKYEFTDLKTITFTASDDELDLLYSFFEEGLYSDKDRSIDIGSNKINTSLYRKGFEMIFVSHSDGTEGYFMLNPKQLRLLFDKTVEK
ncbi:hypothetical protein [Maribacter sp. MAR_2009_72]|uniref:hypothetical protein n=1 Tax=Maribacter sp. MAR_2009_72 TaxID=1250050 RepID=UPI00119A9085|nr:hypothetical protein [Maribacter sp. MAR_2009_72]TVZ14013.1 hypothetical protein JM81_0210 [Maribacter sp. MAR_2009_72]